jgi:hypothetical protein
MSHLKSQDRQAVITDHLSRIEAQCIFPVETLGRRPSGCCRKFGTRVRETPTQIKHFPH